MKKINLTVLLLFIAFSSNAQKGFRVEASIGPTLGDSSDFYSLTLQGNVYYYWNSSENINIGLTSGALVFLGDKEDGFECIGCSVDDYEPELWIPLAVSGRASLSKKISLGLDTGYAFLIHTFDEGSGFYLRPVINYSLKEKLGLVCSFINISDNGYNASTVNLGINIGF